MPQGETCGVTPLPHAWGSADPDGLKECIRCGATNFPKPTPRALVALSDDRQWLVVLEDDAFGRRWRIRHRAYGAYMGNETEDIEDTGQSAEDVLREWMEGRGEGQ